MGTLFLGRYVGTRLLTCCSNRLRTKNFAKCILVAGALLKDLQTFKVQLNFEVSEYSNNWNKVEVAEVSRFYRYFVAFRTQHTNV